MNSLEQLGLIEHEKKGTAQSQKDFTVSDD